MIQKIITPADKLKETNELRRIARTYNFVYVAIVLVVFCLVWLPFQFNWIKSANTDPREAVVRIGTNNAMGTGFLISPNYILTARHVVEAAGIGGEVLVSFEQAQNPIDVLAIVDGYKSLTYSAEDPLSYFESDVAILRLTEEIKQITPLQIGNSDEFKTGEVLIMGYGLDDWSEPDGKITSDSFHKNGRLYKLDASTEPGHSGGPIMKINENGDPTEVVAITVGDFNASFTQKSGHLIKGENVALKINQAANVMSNLGYDIRSMQ